MSRRRAVTPDFFDGLPPHVKVGPYLFRLVPTTAIDPALGPATWGRCHFEPTCIYLLKNQTAGNALNTLVHEITHAINWCAGLNNDSTEEQFTALHTTGLLQVRIDNPELDAWITRQVDAQRKALHVQS